jgi:hypothetical protein
MARAWAMPNGDTFSVAPIGAFVRKYLADSSCSVDPFARNNAWATFLSFGWNSTGMGQKRGYEIIEILIVAHGSAHNDTICMAERKTRTAA